MLIETILYDKPWIPYNDTFVRSRIVLDYPKNLVFTLQYLKEHFENNEAYTRYPDVERFDTHSLKLVEWEKALIVLDRDANVVVAPDPVKRLINLDRRTRYGEAYDYVFGPFASFLSPLHLFRHVWLVWFLVLLFYAWTRLSPRSKYLSLK